MGKFYPFIFYYRQLLLNCHYVANVRYWCVWLFIKNNNAIVQLCFSSISVLVTCGKFDLSPSTQFLLRAHIVDVLQTHMKSADSITTSNSSPMQMNSFPGPLNLTSGRFYLPVTNSVPAFSFAPYFGTGYISPQMYSPHRDKDMRGLPACHTGHCYQPPFQGVMSYHGNNDDKPTQSYIGLIGKAILSSPQQKLVLSDIYDYIQTNYPYFRNRGPGWRNSIRHNLSLNDCFVKVGRSPNGKGHFWAINPINYDDFSRGEYKRKRVSRRNRLPEQTSGQLDERNTRKDIRESSESVIPLNTRCSNKGAENRSFHIERLLCQWHFSLVNKKRPHVRLHSQNTHSHPKNWTNAHDEMTGGSTGTLNNNVLWTLQPSIEQT